MRFFVAILIIGMGVFGGFSYWDLHKAKEQIKEKEVETEEATKKFQDIQRELAKTNGEKGKFSARVDELENAAKNFSETKKAAKDNEDKLNSTQAELDKKAQALEDSKMVATELEESKKKLAERDTELVTAKAELSAAQAQLAAAKAEITRLQTLMAKPPIGGTRPPIR